MANASLRLNLEQKRAVKHIQGPLLIIAGAGTGKTTVITERVKFLIEKGWAKPEEILALTFTERAAQEMEERVDKALPMGYTQTWISTFHSFCERILRNEAIQMGLASDFVILSQAETYLFVKQNLFEFDLKYFRPLGNPTKFISGLVTHFGRLKDEDVEPSGYVRWAQVQSGNSKLETEELEKSIELANAYKKYEELKIKHNVMDFADLISNTLKLFRKRPGVLKKYQQQFKFILIDEFQDTNYAQNHLAVMLAGDDQNITVVADDNQAIYRFRGAAVYNVLDFKKHFPRAKVVSLIKNYRSDQRILDRAYDLIQHNNPNTLEVKAGINKKLKSRVKPTPTDPIRVIFEDRVEKEAEVVAKKVAALVSASTKPQLRTKFLTGLSYKDIAILVRANNHAKPFVQAFSRYGIPHQFLGPGRLYQKPEIKDLIAYLKVLDNFDDNAAVYRVLVLPWLGINRRDIAKLVNLARKCNRSLFETIEQAVADFRQSAQEPEKRPAQNGQMQEETGRKLEKLVKIIHRHLALIPNETPGQILYYFLKDIGLLKKLADPQTEQQQRQTLNISKFFDKIKAFEAHSAQARVKDLVEYLDFVMSAGESPLAAEIDWTEEDAVNLITIHSAKGLEFPVVFMVNLVNERFPTRNRRDQIPVPEEIIHEPLLEGDVHLQEERRLFYVGMTRAKERLYLTGAKFYGEAKRPKKLSPFIYEALGEDLSGYMLGREKSSVAAPFYGAKKEAVQSVAATTTAKRHTVSYLSYSQINTFTICPLHYKLKYILRIPTLPSAAVSFGRTLHETLRQFYSELSKWEVRGGKRDNRSEILERLLELYQKNWISEGYQSREHERERRVQGERYLREFFVKEFDPGVKILALEEPFNFKIGDLKLGGRIDRIDQLPDDLIEIIDYKTGAVKEDKFLKKDLQLSMYALAAGSVAASWQRPLDKIRLSYYYFEAGEKKTIQRSPADLEKAKNQILEIREKMQASDFACSHNRICQKGCEYVLFCNTERDVKIGVDSRR